MNITIPCRGLALATALSLPVFAQTPAADVATEAASTAAAGPALVVKTSNSRMARRLAGMLKVELPEAGEGGHWVLTLDDGGNPNVSAGQGDVGLVDLSARPAQLMEMFADDIAQGKMMAGMMMQMGMAQQGIDAEAASEAVDALFAFPKQIDAVALKVQGDPMLPEAGFKGSLNLTPKAGTWFGNMIDSTHANPAGAPQLTGAGGMMDVRVAMKMTNAAQWMAPMTDFMSNMMAKSDDEKAEFKKLNAQLMNLLDYRGAMTWNTEAGGLLSVFGTSNGEQMTELLNGESYAKWMDRSTAMNPNAEVEITKNAVQHRGVSLTKTLIADMSGAPNPLANEDGEMTQLVGVAGDWMVSTMGSKADGAKGLIDQILDGKVKSSPLGANKLMTMTMRFADFMDMASQGMAPTDDMPQNLKLDLMKKGRSLGLQFNVK